VIKLLSLLNELNIKPKTPIGSGMYHTAFPFEKFKDKIIKTGKGDVDISSGGVKKINQKPLNKKMLDIFQRFPKFFAHVYKITDKYAVIQKLDTEAFKSDSFKLARGLIRLVMSEPRFAKNNTLLYPYAINPSLEPEDIDISYFIYFLTFSRNYRLGKKLRKYLPRDIFDKFYDFFKALDQSGVKNYLPRNRADVHENNLGYDKEGNLKFLDI